MLNLTLNIHINRKITPKQEGKITVMSYGIVLCSILWYSNVRETIRVFAYSYYSFPAGSSYH